MESGSGEKKGGRGIRVGVRVHQQLQHKKEQELKWQERRAASGIEE